MNGVLAFAGNVIVEGDPWQILGGSVTGNLSAIAQVPRPFRRTQHPPRQAHPVYRPSPLPSSRMIRHATGWERGIRSAGEARSSRRDTGSGDGAEHQRHAEPPWHARGHLVATHPLRPPDTSAGSAAGGRVSDYHRRIGRAPTRLGVSRLPYTTTSPAMRSSSSQCSSVVESGPVSYRQPS